MLDGELPQSGGLQGARPQRLVEAHHVSLAATDSGELGVDLPVDVDVDRVDEAVRPGLLRPRPEVTVAHQAPTSPGVEARDAVGPGAGERPADEAHGAVRWDDARYRKGQLVEELGVGGL